MISPLPIDIKLNHNETDDALMESCQVTSLGLQVDPVVCFVLFWFGWLVGLFGLVGWLVG